MQNLTVEYLLKQITRQTVRHYPDEKLDEVVKKVLDKNKELYQRLANC